MPEHFLEDMELFFETMGLKGDIDDFTDGCVALVHRLNMDRDKRPPPSKLERERLSVLDTLQGMDPALVDHIHLRIVERFGHNSGTVGALHQVMHALETPLRTTTLVSGRQLAAVALLWHCREWGISFPDGFVALAKLMKPHLPAIGDPYKLRDLAKEYKTSTFANATEMGSDGEQDEDEVC